MKKLLFTSAFIYLSIFAFSQAEKGIQFENNASWEQVVAKAKKAGWQVLEVVQGEPPAARQALVKLQNSGTSLSAIACNIVLVSPAVAVANMYTKRITVPPLTI